MRSLNFAGLLACCGMLAYALFAQYGLHLDPCPLCILQRVAVLGMGLGFLLLAAHNPGPGWAQRAYLGILFVFAAAGMTVAGRHVWLQNLPPDKVPSCGPGLDYMLDAFPFAEALKMVFTGSGECAAIDWSFIGLSMPAWVLIAIVAMTGSGLWNNLLRPR